MSALSVVSCCKSPRTTRRAFLFLLGSIREKLGDESPHEGNEVFGRIFGDELEGLSLVKDGVGLNLHGF